MAAMPSFRMTTLYAQYPATTVHSTAASERTPLPITAPTPAIRSIVQATGSMKVFGESLASRG